MSWTSNAQQLLALTAFNMTLVSISHCLQRQPLQLCQKKACQSGCAFSCQAEEALTRKLVAELQLWYRGAKRRFVSRFAAEAGSDDLLCMAPEAEEQGGHDADSEAAAAVSASLDISHLEVSNLHWQPFAAVHTCTAISCLCNQISGSFHSVHKLFCADLCVGSVR